MSANSFHQTQTNSQCDEDEDEIYLSLNIGEGEKLVLSDGSTYEIAPADQPHAAYWITPFPIMLSESGDPDYPIKITNMNTGTFVRGKQLVTSEVIEEERQKRLETKKKQKAQPQPPQESDETEAELEPDETPEPKKPNQKPQVKLSRRSSTSSQP